MSAQATDLSFEFFPPRSGDASTSFEKTLVDLRELSPNFCSVTYGAGGSTREGTFQTVTKLQSTGVVTAAHLSMGNESEASIGELLGDYTSAGVQRIVALRGDTTSGSGRGAPKYAEELVRFIRAHSGDKFHVSVAAYPETHPDAASPEADLDFFKRKVDAGADSAITQYFYNASAYYDFVDRAHSQGVDIPIIPGIMPITNYSSLARFSNKAGADIPRWLDRRLQALEKDSAGLQEFGLQVVSRLCEELLANGAPGLHFYTLNRAKATKTIIKNLALR